MMIKILLKVLKFHFIMVIPFLVSSLPSNGQASLSIEVSGIKNDKGNLLFSIYNETSVFPDSPLQYVNVTKEGMEDNTINFTFAGLEPGRYAVIVIDDEDSDEVLDKNFVGIPKEGYVFSNDAKPKGFKTPGFEESYLELPEGMTDINMELIYHKN
jgi:uncharacterized protein (DUF2141 family)